MQKLRFSLEFARNSICASMRNYIEISLIFYSKHKKIFAQLFHAFRAKKCRLETLQMNPTSSVQLPYIAGVFSHRRLR